MIRNFGGDCYLVRVNSRNFMDLRSLNSPRKVPFGTVQPPAGGPENMESTMMKEKRAQTLAELQDMFSSSLEPEVVKLILSESDYDGKKLFCTSYGTVLYQQQTGYQWYCLSALLFSIECFVSLRSHGAGFAENKNHRPKRESSFD